MVVDRPTLLIVEDDIGLQKQLKWCFDEYHVCLASDRAQAVSQVRRFAPAVVLQDLGLPPDPHGVDEGLRTLQDVLAIARHCKVIVVTGNGDRANAVRAVSMGATDFCDKPVDTQTLKLIVARAFRVHELEQQGRVLANASSATPLGGIVATDEEMVRVCRTIEKVAPSDLSVLILGETGTGKELIARSIHDLSRRRSHRFVAINCAAIPEHLLEAELFGHEKGAFTGALKQTQGRIEMADGGTLFLDEIGDMPAPLQAKLLRFLQNRVIERVGGRQEIAVDTRVVCATHRNLQSMIADGRFRQDLYYRIGAVTITAPPLRHRGADVVVLAYALLARFSEEAGIKPRSLAGDALSALRHYDWPGNVREMENKLRAALLMSDGPLITASDLGLTAPADESLPMNLSAARADAERRAVVQALAMAGNNLSHAASLLGISRPTLYNLLSRCQIKMPEA